VTVVRDLKAKRGKEKKKLQEEERDKRTGNVDTLSGVDTIFTGETITGREKKMERKGKKKRKDITGKKNHNEKDGKESKNAGGKGS